MKHYDAIIIGSGQGGTPLAKKLATYGWKTALVEKKHVGGTCVNVGCTPTKTMIASAKVAYTVAKAGKWGIQLSNTSIDFATVLARKNKVVESFRDGSRKGLEKIEELSLVFGEASFVDASTIEVLLSSGGKEIMSADKIFINTGARPRIPDIKGLEETGYFTSTSLMEFETVPPHLLIIGGGYIGLEFGQMYRRFGSKVTILQDKERFLPREDEDIADEVLKFLHAEEITVITNAQTTQVEKVDNEIIATVKVANNVLKINCSHILVATGTTPNTESLNLNAAGIKTSERNHIAVNEKLETTAKNIYALGDVKGGPEFTHIAYNDHIILCNNLLNGKNETTKDRPVPYTMFTDPQLGSIGITEQEARKEAFNIKVATLPMANVARAIETGDTRGMMKAIVDADSGQILGATILGPEGGETMSVLQMAMAGKIPWYVIKDMVFAHPLYAESLNNLFMTLDKNHG